eukprot:gene6519-1162_t
MDVLETFVGKFRDMDSDDMVLPGPPCPGHLLAPYCASTNAPSRGSCPGIPYTLPQPHAQEAMVAYVLDSAGPSGGPCADAGRLAASAAGPEGRTAGSCGLDDGDALSQQCSQSDGGSSTGGGFSGEDPTPLLDRAAAAVEAPPEGVCHGCGLRLEEPYVGCASCGIKWHTKCGVEAFRDGAPNPMVLSLPSHNVKRLVPTWQVSCSCKTNLDWGILIAETNARRRRRDLLKQYCTMRRAAEEKERKKAEKEAKRREREAARAARGGGQGRRKRKADDNTPATPPCLEASARTGTLLSPSSPIFSLGGTALSAPPVPVFTPLSPPAGSARPTATPFVCATTGKGPQSLSPKQQVKDIGVKVNLASTWTREEIVLWSEESPPFPSTAPSPEHFHSTGPASPPSTPLRGSDMDMSPRTPGGMEIALHYPW